MNVIVWLVILKMALFSVLIIAVRIFISIKCFIDEFFSV